MARVFFREVLRATTGRHIRPLGSGLSGGGGGGDPGGPVSGVITSGSLTFLGAFTVPDFIGSPASQMTAYTNTDGSQPVVALRRVSGNVHLFLTGTIIGGSPVYEITVPASGTWSQFPASGTSLPVATIWRNWGGECYYNYHNRRWEVSAATLSTVTLNESKWRPPHYYSGWHVLMLDGAHSGVARYISGYDSVTRVASIGPNWSITPPVAGDAYVLYQGTLQSGNTVTAQLPATGFFSTNSGAHVWQFIWAVAGAGSGQADMITAYSGLNRMATLRFGSLPCDNTTRFRLVTLHRATTTEGAEANRWNGGGYGDGSASTLVDGLFWDDEPEANFGQRLYWGYGYWYNGNLDNPTIGYSKLDEVTTTSVPFGPWHLESGSPKWARGGVCDIASGFRAAHLASGKRLMAGYGGYYSLEADASYGPCAGAVAPPPSGLQNIPNAPYGQDSTTNDFPKLADTRLLGHPASTFPGPPYSTKRNLDYRNRDPKPPFLGRQSDDSPAYNIRASGLCLGAVSGSAGEGSYLILNSGDDKGLWFYNGCTLQMGGTTSGKTYLISVHDPDGAAPQKRVYIFSQFSGGIPVSGDNYHIRGARVFMGGYEIGHPNQWTNGPFFKENRLATGKGLGDHTLEITSGVGSGQRRFMVDNLRDTVATMSGGFSMTLTEPFTTLPLGSGAAGLPSAWRVFGGLAQSGSANQLALQSGSLFSQASYSDREYYINILGGLSSGDMDKLILSGSSFSKVLTISGVFSMGVDHTSEYGIYATGLGPTVWDPVSGDGYWTWEDTVANAGWFHGTNKKGVLFPVTLGHGHIYYEASDVNSSSGHQPWLMSYDPDDLLPVLSGTIGQSEVDWTDCFQPPQLNVPYVENGMYWALAIDKTDKVLYAMRVGVVPVNLAFKPAVYVYQIVDQN